MSIAQLAAEVMRAAIQANAATNAENSLRDHGTQSRHVHYEASQIQHSEIKRLQTRGK